MSADDIELDYKIRCVEKENDRLIELVKHSRQNALALVAAVFLVVSTTLLSIGEPRLTDLKKAQYEEVLQARFMGLPRTPERDRAIQLLSIIWDSATTVTVSCAAIVIVLTVLIFSRSAKYGPDRATLESMTAEKYLALLLDQFDELFKLNKRSRRLLIWALSIAVVMMVGCFSETLLWIWFGIEAKSSP